MALDLNFEQCDVSENLLVFYVFSLKDENMMKFCICLDVNWSKIVKPHVSFLCLQFKGRKYDEILYMP